MRWSRSAGGVRTRSERFPSPHYIRTPARLCCELMTGLSHVIGVHFWLRLGKLRCGSCGKVGVPDGGGHVQSASHERAG